MLAASRRLDGIAARSGRGAQSESRPPSVPAPQSRRIRARGERAARARRRRQRVPAARHDQRRLRQRRRRADVLGDADGRLPARREPHQRAGRRRSEGRRRRSSPTRCRAPARRCSTSRARRSARAAASPSMHTFPADGDYSFRMQLHSIPTGQLFGSTVKGELLEVSIDGERAAVLEINPRMSEADPNGMNIVTPRIHVKAGTHRLAAAFVQRFDAVPRRPDAADRSHAGRLADRLGLRHHDAAAPARLRGRRAVQGHRRVRHAEPPQASSPAGRRRRPKRRRARTRSSASWRRRRIAVRSTRAGHRRPDEVLRAGPQGRRLRGGHPHGAAGDAGEPALPVPPRRSAGDGARRAELPHHRSRSGDAAVVLPLGHGSRRRAAEGRAARHAARPGRAGGAGQAHARRSASPKRSRRGSDRSGCACRTSRRSIRTRCCSRTTTTSSAKRCKKETELFFDSIVREDRSILDLLTADYTFVNERVARHYGIPNINGANFRRVTLADENRRGLLGQGSILALTSVADRTSPVLRGKWIMEVLLGVAAAGAAAERADARRDQGRSRRRHADDAPAHGAAPRQSAVQLVPPRDRSARPGARELRRHRPLAHPRQRRRSSIRSAISTTARR